MNQMSQNQLPKNNSTISPFVQIDPEPIIKHGESPTAIILAITVLLVLILGSVTKLVYVILMRDQVKPPQ